jgi:hypothetical protein
MGGFLRYQVNIDEAHNNENAGGDGFDADIDFI